MLVFLLVSGRETVTSTVPAADAVLSRRPASQSKEKRRWPKLQRALCYRWNLLHLLQAEHYQALSDSRHREGADVEVSAVNLGQKGRKFPMVSPRQGLVRSGILRLGSAVTSGAPVFRRQELPSEGGRDNVPSPARSSGEDRTTRARGPRGPHSRRPAPDLDRRTAPAAPRIARRVAARR